jgi:quercetin dioxygenase-like cupin family protein
VVRGAIRFEIGGRSHELGPGDRLMLPGGTVHAALAGPDGATYLIGRRDAAPAAPAEEDE